MNSNGKSDKITLNSCQYTPIYLIQNSSVSEVFTLHIFVEYKHYDYLLLLKCIPLYLQGRSFVLAPTIKEDSRPVSNNLKLFYENSGNIENSVLIDNVQYVANPPAAPAKKVQEPLGNNLKLASFLVPKKDATKDQYIATISNKILKPTVNSSNTNVLPNINIVTSKPNGSRSKANAPRTLINPRLLPKIKPKEKYVFYHYYYLLFFVKFTSKLYLKNIYLSSQNSRAVQAILSPFIKIRRIISQVS